MHSIRVKLFILVFGSMVGLFLLMSYMSMHFLVKVEEEDYVRSVDLLVNDKVTDLNNGFDRIESGVRFLENYIRDNVDTEKLSSDNVYNYAFFDKLSVRCADLGELAKDAVAVYFRPDPEKYGASSGVFMVDDGGGDFKRVEPTDLSKYSETDREYASWYYEPKEKGVAMWVKPYHNKNINVYMMSFVVPIYMNREFLGVAGMDIRMSFVSNIVESVNYKNSSAFFFSDDGDILYHKEYPDGLPLNRFNSDMRGVAKYITNTGVSGRSANECIWKGEPYRITSTVLDNGMIFALAVPKSQIKHTSNQMQLQMIVVFFFVMISVFLVFWRLMITIVIPIKELTRASERMSKGELNMVVNYRSGDELGDLAKSISKMGMEIKDYFAYIHTQAYTDAMTGVGNKAAYMDQVKLMEQKIKEGMASFMVVVFDVNGLKNVNDNLGHEYGDMLIKDAADIMKKIFSTENVYRIGGDEFIVVMENRNEKDIEVFFRQFDEDVATFNKQNTRYDNDLAVSKGGVIFDPENDKAYKDVFRRADEIMYQDKSAFYRGRNDRRRR